MSNDENDSVGGTPDGAPSNLVKPRSRVDFYDLSKKEMSTKQITAALNVAIDYMSTAEFKDAYGQYSSNIAKAKHAERTLEDYAVSDAEVVRLDEDIEAYVLGEKALHGDMPYWPEMEKFLDSEAFENEYDLLTEIDTVVEPETPQPVANAQAMLSHLFKPSSIPSQKEFVGEVNSLIFGQASGIAKGQDLIDQFYTFNQEMNAPKASHEFPSLPEYHNRLEKYAIDNEWGTQTAQDEFRGLVEAAGVKALFASDNVKRINPDVTLPRTLEPDDMDLTLGTLSNEGPKKSR